MAELKIAPLRAETGRNAPARNEACKLDLGWVRDVRVNLSAAERRVATLPGRRTVKKDAQA
ncbi:MAG: deoxyribose-phosphate aldolase, partial [Rhodospirillales bacterium]|nr:deoxyribose-phosphate aldolase [Rhodospirillales bacterium]